MDFIKKLEQIIKTEEVLSNKVWIEPADNMVIVDLNPDCQAQMVQHGEWVDVTVLWQDDFDDVEPQRYGLIEFSRIEIRDVIPLLRCASLISWLDCHDDRCHVNMEE